MVTSAWDVGKQIIEEEYHYTTDTPNDIARIIDSYVNYT